MIKSGSCGGALISTKSECDAAATALDLSDKSANDYSSGTYSSYPPGCQLVSSTLYVFGGGSTGSCSSSRKCICMSTPPSPPALPPSPPSQPPPPYTFTSTAALRTAVYAFNANPASAIATYGPVADWDVSAITDMSRLFYSQKFNADLSNWDTSGVTDMSQMFNVRSAQKPPSSAIPSTGL